MTLLFHGKLRVPAHNYFLFQQTHNFVWQIVPFPRKLTSQNLYFKNQPFRTLIFWSLMTGRFWLTTNSKPSRRRDLLHGPGRQRNSEQKSGLFLRRQNLALYFAGFLRALKNIINFSVMFQKNKLSKKT
jgi:hypothetical protein